MRFAQGMFYYDLILKIKPNKNYIGEFKQNLIKFYRILTQKALKIIKF